MTVEARIETHSPDSSSDSVLIDSVMEYAVLKLHTGTYTVFKHNTSH